MGVGALDVEADSIGSFRFDLNLCYQDVLACALPVQVVGRHTSSRVVEVFVQELSIHKLAKYPRLMRLGKQRTSLELLAMSEKAGTDMMSQLRKYASAEL